MARFLASTQWHEVVYDGGRRLGGAAAAVGGNGESGRGWEMRRDEPTVCVCHEGPVASF
jgi:hypothetical protein